MSVVGERIRQCMREQGMTQNSLARMAQLSQSGLSSIINGTVSPKEETVRAIATALGVSPSYLIGDDTAQGMDAGMKRLGARQEGHRILDELPEEAYTIVLAMLRGLCRGEDGEYRR